MRDNSFVTLQAGTAEPKTAVFLLGVSTVVAQALLLREAMATMGGSEMAWGTVMGLWLIGMGIGSRIGIRFGSTRLATWMPVTTLVLAGSAVVLFRAAPALIGATSGEVLTTASAIWLWVAAVVPTALAGGVAFPILAGALGSSGGGRAYAIEAVGALAGGCAVSLILMRLGSAAALCTTLALVLAASLWWRSRTLAVIVGIAGIAVAPVAADALARAGWRWSGNPGELSDWRETRLQRLEVSVGPPTVVFADGQLVASYPDPYQVLPKAHLMMLLHPDPQNVIAVGCAVDGSVEAMSRHPVERLVIVEEDPVLLRSLPEWYGSGVTSALAQPQVQPLSSDPLRAITESGPWDLVILADGNPTTLRRNRTRTLEFLRSCRAAMSPDGVLVMRIVVADTYLGGTAGRLLETLSATVREVFPVVDVIPGEEILLVAGGHDAQIDLGADTLTRRLRNRGLESSMLPPEMIPLLTDRNRADSVRESLAASAPLNTVRHPRAVLLAGGLHESRSRPPLLNAVLEAERRGAWPLAVILGIAVLGLLSTSLSRRPPVVATASVVGLVSMGWWLLLVATWQATRGSVYSEIGALTATFMAGLAAGATVACRWNEPAKHLPPLLASSILESLLLASGIAIGFPLVAVPLLLAAGGALTGAAFPGLTALGAGHVRRGAGVAFAADEAGAALGAVMIGIFALPWAGLTATALGLGLLSLAAIPAVVASLRRN